MTTMTVKMEDGEMAVNLERRMGCPIFSGKVEDFASWRIRVEDWMELSEVKVEKRAIEMRMSLQGKAFNLVKDISREDLKGEDGAKLILEKLDKKYKGDVVVERYNKIDRYLDIERKEGESVGDFISRYEETANGCFQSTGNILEGEIKGIHLLKRSGLDDKEKQMVLAACGSDKLTFEKISGMMERVFGELGKSDDKQINWYGEKFADNQMGIRQRTNTAGAGGNNYRGRGYNKYQNSYNNRGKRKNPPNRFGVTTTCSICKSEYHWVKQCPKNIMNKEKVQCENLLGNEEEKIEQTELKKTEQIDDIFFEEISKYDVEAVEGLVDTGCKNSVIGKL